MLEINIMADTDTSLAVSSQSQKHPAGLQDALKATYLLDQDKTMITGLMP